MTKTLYTIKRKKDGELACVSSSPVDCPHCGVTIGYSLDFDSDSPLWLVEDIETAKKVLDNIRSVEHGCLTEYETPELSPYYGRKPDFQIERVRLATQAAE